jgi:methylenetetrahydrofolate reductase (NADPH)
MPNRDISVSFEFFPPRSDKARVALSETAERLAKLGPAFMTVTYGAGGTTSDPTLNAVLDIQGRTGVPTASHLTYVSTPIYQVATYAESLKAAGIGHVVALRGDPPPGKPGDRHGGAGFYHSTPAFVASLNKAWGFDISVSAYPEKHPDTPSAEGDIDMLARKQDAGAKRAITQFFFDNDIFFKFRDDADAEGVTIPVVPGVLPIMDFVKMTGFAARCGASVPDWLHARFAGVTDAAEAKKIASDVLAKQVEGLMAGGCEHIHVFTLNDWAMTEELCRATGLGMPRIGAKVA